MTKTTYSEIKQELNQFEKELCTKTFYLKHYPALSLFLRLERITGRNRRGKARNYANKGLPLFKKISGVSLAYALNTPVACGQFVQSKEDLFKGLYRPGLKAAKASISYQLQLAFNFLTLSVGVDSSKFKRYPYLRKIFIASAVYLIVYIICRFNQTNTYGKKTKPLKFINSFFKYGLKIGNKAASLDCKKLLSEFVTLKTNLDTDVKFLNTDTHIDRIYAVSQSLISDVFFRKTLSAFFTQNMRLKFHTKRTADSTFKTQFTSNKDWLLQFVDNNFKDISEKGDSIFEALKESGSRHHFIAANHQLGFCAVINNEDTRVSKCNVVKASQKLGRGESVSIEKNFCVNYAFDDEDIYSLQADRFVVSNEERTYRFEDLFRDSLSDADLSKYLPILPKLTVHLMKRNIFLKEWVSDALVDGLAKKVLYSPDANSLLRDYAKKFVRKRHAPLDSLFKQLPLAPPEALPLIFSILQLTSMLDAVSFIVNNAELENLVFEGLKRARDLLHSDTFKLFITTSAKWGQIVSMQESSLESSRYVKELANSFKFEFIKTETGLVLPDNAIAFVSKDKIPYKYCFIEDFSKIAYVLIPISKNVLVVGTAIGESAFDEKALSPNMLLTQVANKGFISTELSHEEYRENIGRANPCPTELIEEGEFDFDSLANELRGWHALKSEILKNSSIDDIKAFSSKITKFISEVEKGIEEASSFKISTLYVDSDIPDFELRVESRSKVTTTKLIDFYVTVPYGSDLSFSLSPDVIRKNKIAWVQLQIFNTGSDALHKVKHQYRTEVDAKLKRVTSFVYTKDFSISNKQAYFRWDTAGAYVGNHLAIFTLFDQNGCEVGTKKIWVRVSK